MMVIISGLAISYVSIQQYRQTLITQARNHLGTIREARIHDIREYFQLRLQDIDGLASQSDIIKTLAIQNRRDSASRDLSVSFAEAAEQVGNYLTYYSQKTDYYDILLISPAGNIVYTVAGESDLGTNLISGIYKKSELAKAFLMSKDLLQAQVVINTYYTPLDQPAIFLATPVFDEESLVGVIAVQLRLSGLFDAVASLTGLGESGEVVAGVLRQGASLLIAPLRHRPDAAMKLSVPLGEGWLSPLQSALRGSVGHGASIDYRGERVEAAWGYVPELEMGIVVKMDVSELLEPLGDLGETFFMAVLLILILTVLAAIALARSIAKPVESLQRSTSSYADGMFNVRSHINTGDEIGQLATAFNTLADNIEHYNAEIREKNAELEGYGQKLEQQVHERTATLSAANEEIKSFAYIVSHDLRSPLVNLKGFAGELDYTLQEISARVEAIQSRLDEGEAEKMASLIKEDIPESMRFINNAVEKMDHMLSSILKLSRLGKRELAFESVDLEAVCRDALSSLTYQLEKFHVKTVLEYLPTIRNDRLVMGQIMGNLIGNAVKYLDPERSGMIRIWSEDSASGITIYVRDNGMGIQPHEKEKVFQIFRRGRHESVQGEGMGLAYVLTLVRAQGGNIYFEPAPDCGTVFAVFLPLQNLESTI